jgi:hypothetical protein
MTEPDRRSGLFTGLLAVAIGIAIAGALVALGIKDIKRAGDEVTVTGSARRPITSDFVIWRATVTGQDVALPVAFRELQSRSDKVLQYLRAHGVPDSVLTVRPLETYNVPQYSRDGREMLQNSSYRVSQTFEVRSSDVEGTTKLSGDLSQLINDGVPVQAQPPEYLYTRLADIRVEMLAAATRDARVRAEQIAKSAGSEIGRVRTVRVGVFQITPRFSTEVADYGINDTSSRDKDITAVVRVTFALD